MFPDQRRVGTIFCYPLVLLVASSVSADVASPERQPVDIDSFSLRDYRGKLFSFSDDQDSPIVVLAFLGTECPLAKLYGPRLQEIADRYSPRGVVVFGIFSNQQDAPTEIGAYARRHDIKFPLLKDLSNALADRVGAERTPEVVVLDAQRVCRYQGRIDDQYGVGYARQRPDREDLCLALDALLSGQRVPMPRTAPVGCLIGRVREAVEDSEVTYAQQISRLFQSHCVECHREGEIAPFALTDYDEVVGWADMIAEVVRERRMPPWHADPSRRRFENERWLSDEQIELVERWADNGAPLGDASQIPPPRTYIEGWRLPKEPDLIVAMRSQPFVVPADGVVEYQYFAVDPGFQEDKWVVASDIVPGAREVVHHAIVFVSPPAERRSRGLGWLGAYVPGQRSRPLPTGHARLVPAGSKFIFQMHYTPNGSEQPDHTKIGLVFADEDDVEQEVLTLYAVEGNFEIPPFAKNHRVDAWIDEWPADARLLSMVPHMHVRGRSFRFVAHYADGRQEELLHVPRYDFNWQNNYRLATPLPIPPGFAVHCSGRYDNSASNLLNPDPSQSVRWGDQSWEEMMIAFFEVAVPRGSRAPVIAAQPTSAERQTAAETAARIFRRFDLDEDQLLVRSELPGVFAAFAFQRYDIDADRRISVDEVRTALLRGRSEN